MGFAKQLSDVVDKPLDIWCGLSSTLLEASEQFDHGVKNCVTMRLPKLSRILQSGRRGANASRFLFNYETCATLDAIQVGERDQNVAS